MGGWHALLLQSSDIIVFSTISHYKPLVEAVAAPAGLPHEWVCDGNYVDSMVFTGYGERWHGHDGAGMANVVMCIPGRYFCRQLRQRIDLLASCLITPLNTPTQMRGGTHNIFLGPEWGVGVVTH